MFEIIASFVILIAAIYTSILLAFSCMGVFCSFIVESGFRKNASKASISKPSAFAVTALWTIYFSKIYLLLPLLF